MHVSGPDVEDRKTRSPLVAALGTLLLFGFCILCASQLLDALLTGRTRFPAKWNDVYVTWTANPGWFTASVIAWLLMMAFMAHVSILGWKHLVRLVRGGSLPKR